MSKKYNHSFVAPEEVEAINEYYCWLLDEFGIFDSRYCLLLKALHRKEFYSFIPHDENRAVDGKKLRALHDPSNMAVSGPCSVLEMLIGLSIRIEREIDEPITHIFWMLLNNLELTEQDDRRFDDEEVNHILDTFLDRTYCTDGKGGLFPLKTPQKDQRKVEIWYQFQAFLIENYEF